MDQKRFAAEPDEWILDAWFTDQEDSLLNGTVTLPLASYLTASGALEMAEAADRLIGWATAMKLRALSRVEQAMGEEWRGRREEQPERLGGEETHALAVAEVATTCAVSENTAARLLHDAADLAGLGASQWEVLEALEDGQVSPAHLRVILDASRTVPEDYAEKFSRAALQRLTTRTGRRRTPSELRACLRKLRAKMHPEPLEARTKAASRERGVWFAPDPDGMCTVTAHLPAEAGLAIYTGLDNAARVAKSRAAQAANAQPANAQPIGAGLTSTESTGASTDPALGAPTLVAPAVARVEHERTLSELRADALVQRLLGVPWGPEWASADTRGSEGAGAGSGEGAGPGWDTGAGSGAAPFRPEVVVTIPIELALGADQAADRAGMLASAELEGYGPIDSATARRLASLAPTWFQLFTDPVTGRALGVGRTAYRPPKALRRYLAHRDGGCVFPTCTHPARSCEPDHIIEWQDGGTTDPDNLALLCHKHHALKSIGAWTYARSNPDPAPGSGSGSGSGSGGSLAWRSPIGRTHTTDPTDERQPVHRLASPPDDPLAGRPPQGGPPLDPQPPPF